MDPARIGEWLSRHLPDSTVHRITELAGGWESDIYRLAVTHAGGQEDLVLRLYAGEAAPRTARREYAGMRHLHSVGYPVPRVIAAEPDPMVLGRPFLVMDWVPGEADRSWPEALTGPALDDFVGLLVDLHAVDTQPLTGRSPAGDPTETLQAWAPLTELHPTSGFEIVLEWLMTRAHGLTPTAPSVLHWDFHVGNVLVAPGDTVHVVDWTQIEVNDRRFDVAWTALLIEMAVGDDAARSFCLGYDRQAGSLPDMEFFHAAAAVKRLFSVAISLAAGPESLGMRPEAAERMRRDLPTLAIPYRTVQSITGVGIPAVDELLEA